MGIVEHGARIALVAAAVATAALGGGAFAASPTVKITPNGAQASFNYMQVTLTAAVVQKFIQTYPTLKAKTDAVAAKYNVKVSNSPLDGSFMAYASSTAAAGEMNAAVTPSGYKDIFEWTNTMMTIVYATQWAVMGAQLASAPANSGVVVNKPTQANIDAVKPYAAQLVAFVNQ